MQVIPVLDLRGGCAVHARGGERSAYAPVSSRLVDGAGGGGDPLVLAAAYRSTLGCREIYVADLDAILGREPQHDVIRALAAEGAHCWVDMGIASPDRAREALDDGATRVIVGLETLPARQALESLVEIAGASRVVFSLDLQNGRPMTRVDELAAMTPVALAELAAEAGVRTVIVLDLARIGTGSGVDLALVQQLRRALPHVAVVAGGGVGRIGDLERLAAAGAHGALVASALHDGRIGAAAIAAVARIP